VWNSHRDWSWDYVHSCAEQLRRDSRFVFTQRDQFFLRKKNCLDKWHPGWALTLPVTRLLVNHVCAVAKVTRANRLHLNFV